jgi:hypothetical protein
MGESPRPLTSGCSCGARRARTPRTDDTAPWPENLDRRALRFLSLLSPRGGAPSLALCLALLAVARPATERSATMADARAAVEAGFDGERREGRRGRRRHHGPPAPPPVTPHLPSASPPSAAAPPPTMEEKGRSFLQGIVCCWGKIYWVRERGRRAFRGGSRQGREWPELAGIKPAAEVVSVVGHEGVVGVGLWTLGWARLFVARIFRPKYKIAGRVSQIPARD